MWRHFTLCISKLKIRQNSTTTKFSVHQGSSQVTTNFVFRYNLTWTFQNDTNIVTITVVDSALSMRLIWIGKGLNPQFVELRSTVMDYSECQRQLVPKFHENSSTTICKIRPAERHEIREWRIPSISVLRGSDDHNHFLLSTCTNYSWVPSETYRQNMLAVQTQWRFLRGVWPWSAKLSVR